MKWTFSYTYRLYRISAIEKQTQMQVILFTLNNKKPVLCVFKNIRSGLQLIYWDKYLTTTRCYTLLFIIVISHQLYQEVSNIFEMSNNLVQASM